MRGRWRKEESSQTEQRNVRVDDSLAENEREDQW